MRWSGLPLAMLLLALAACGGRPDDGQPAPQVKEKTVFDPMLQQRDKVKAMADKLPDERKDNLDRAIDSGAQ